MKSTWFRDPKRHDFARCIGEADYSRHPGEIFNSWLTVASCSLRQAVHRFCTGRPCEKIEQTVVKEQQSIKHPERFPEALGILVDALESNACDFLGITLSELGINDKKWKGQVFTPQSLSEAMARITLSDVEPEDGRTLMLLEPACGGGSMVIAATKVLRENGFYPWHYYWQAVDLDWRCFAMTYIQLTLLGIPAGVIQGNTLSLEVFDSATTFVGVLHPPKERNDDVASPVVVASEPQSQLALF